MHGVSGLASAEPAGASRRRRGAFFDQLTPGRLLAFLVLFAVYAIYVLGKVETSRLHDLIWLCNVSCAVLVVFFLTRQRLWQFVGFVWILAGSAAWAWVIFILGGASSHADVIAVHVAGVTLGFLRVAGHPVPWRWGVTAGLYYLLNLVVFLSWHDSLGTVPLVRYFLYGDAPLAEKVLRFTWYHLLLGGYVVALMALLRWIARRRSGRGFL